IIFPAHSPTRVAMRIAHGIALKLIPVPIQLDIDPLQITENQDIDSHVHTGLYRSRQFIPCSQTRVRLILWITAIQPSNVPTINLNDMNAAGFCLSSDLRQVLEAKTNLIVRVADNC